MPLLDTALASRQGLAAVLDRCTGSDAWRTQPIAELRAHLTEDEFQVYETWLELERIRQTIDARRAA